MPSACRNTHWSATRSGGAVALGFALAHPQNVERLVLMAPGGLNDLPDYLAMPGMAAMFAAFRFR